MFVPKIFYIHDTFFNKYNIIHWINSIIKIIQKLTKIVKVRIRKTSKQNVFVRLEL